jgi:hypothetical protein
MRALRNRGIALRLQHASRTGPDRVAHRLQRPAATGSRAVRILSIARLIALPLFAYSFG